MLLASSDRGVRYSRMIRTLVLPQRLVGETKHHERRDIAGVHCPGMQHPQRQRVGRALGQHDVALEGSDDVVK